MDDATAIRQKENAAWSADTAEIQTAMVALQQAITVLLEATKSETKAGEASFLQANEKATVSVRMVIGDLPSHATLKPEQLDELSSFLQAGITSKYMPQSMTVQ